MTNRLQITGSYGNGYFSQAVADYAARMKPEDKTEDGKPKTIGEFSEKEWDQLLDKVDNAIEDYKADLKEREKEALEKQKEQRESYILGAGNNEDKQFEERVLMDNGSFRTMRFMKIDSMDIGASAEMEQPDIEDTIDDMVAEEAIQKLLDKGNRAPYSLMADENGIVKYKGVEFRCDYENNRLCLGDVSNPKNCITVGLERGGCLVFNRENIDDLVKAIDMFSPEDINRIMRAIAQDAKLRQMQVQIEDETSGEAVLDKPEEEKEKYESERQTEQSYF
ncbi:MAG: hypothetical protein HFH37_00035 [Lachnospiraceae bacterium]|nr:hypothetical protein [Lachnospiraceae bacterium]